MVAYQLSYIQRIVLSKVIRTLLCSVYKLILYRLVVRCICCKCISSVKCILLSRFPPYWNQGTCLCVLVFCKRLCQWISQGSMLSWPADSVSSVNWLLGSMECRCSGNLVWGLFEVRNKCCLRIVSKSGVKRRKKQGLETQHLPWLGQLQLQRLENPRSSSVDLLGKGVGGIWTEF